MNFITKIFENKIDQDVHNQFTRFSLGTFENRALMKLTISKDKLKLNTSYDLVKDISLMVAENFDKIGVKGKIFQGRKKEEIEKTVSGEELKKICEENPFVLLNLEFEDYSVKVGKSLPKPGNKLKDNFCKCILPKSFAKEFIDKENLKKAVIKHTFIIEDIIVPKECENDPSMARKLAKRKGKILREIDIDGKEKKSEINFEA